MDKQDSMKDLLANQRRQKILELLQEEGSARVRDLSVLFDVSEPTIRQDLEKLEEQGTIKREHGGAYLTTIPQQVKNQSLQHSENIDRKKAIARKAAEFIQPGDRIILDSGSTITELAKEIVHKENLVVITNALNIALILGANPSCELMVTGGEFKAPTLSLTGEKAALFLQNLFVEKLFLATGGISPNYELTYPGFLDLPVKKAMLHVAREVYLLADSTKFGKASFASLGSIDCVKYLITDDGIEKETLKHVLDLGVQVIIG